MNKLTKPIIVWMLCCCHLFLYGQLSMVQKLIATPGEADYGLTVAGDRLYYTSTKKEAAVKRSHLYTLDREDINGPETYINATNISCFNRSKEGPYITFMQDNFVNGKPQINNPEVHFSIFTGEMDEKGNWVKVNPFPYNNAAYSNAYPFLSEDGQELYFTSNRAGGFGGYDLYVSTRLDSGWSEPQNLGSAVNSEGNEMTPFIANDLLYFSSDGYPGAGGMDVYRISFNGGIVEGEPVALIEGINSESDDYGLVIDASNKKVYFTSNRDSKNYEDIYMLSEVSDQQLVVQKQREIVVSEPMPETPKLLCSEPQKEEPKHQCIQVPLNKYDYLLTTNSSEKTSKEKEYRVRLGTFKTVNDFDATSVNQLGKITQQKWNGYIIVFVGDFETKEAAQQALTVVKANEFKNATIVAEVDGRMKSIY